MLSGVGRQRTSGADASTLTLARCHARRAPSRRSDPTGSAPGASRSSRRWAVGPLRRWAVAPLRRCAGGRPRRPRSGPGPSAPRPRRLSSPRPSSLALRRAADPGALLGRRPPADARDLHNPDIGGAVAGADPGDERNVLGGPLELCGTEPLAGFYRDGSCTSGPEDLGLHTVCAVVSADFLALQRELGNDLSTPHPEFGFPGLRPGDRWCVVAVRWLQAYQAGAAAGVVLAATNARALEIVPLEALRQHAVDVPDDISGLERARREDPRPPGAGAGMTELLDLPLTSLGGKPTTVGQLTAGKAALVVNVASRCGLTPQYAGLEALHEEYRDRGFTVVGIPCNQFMGQEPGTAEEIATFCSATYGVTFPMTEKLEVNGPGAHPLYRELTASPDAAGEAGDVQWNFEMSRCPPAGEVVGRFRPKTQPDAPEVIASVDAVLPA